MTSSSTRLRPGTATLILRWPPMIEWGFAKSEPEEVEELDVEF